MSSTTENLKRDQVENPEWASLEDWPILLRVASGPPCVNAQFASP